MVRVVDGDTIDVMVDMGFQTHCRQRLRLLGVDMPERGKAGFAEASEETARLLQGEITVYTVKKDSFGRWLAEVYVDGVHVNRELQARGWGVPVG